MFLSPIKNRSQYLFLLNTFTIYHATNRESSKKVYIEANNIYNLVELYQSTKH